MKRSKNSYETSGFAIAGLILGILSFVSFFIFFLSIPFGIMALIFGFVALSKIKKGEVKGKGMAIAGIVLGILGIILSIVFIFLFISILDSVVPKKGYLLYNDIYKRFSVSYPDDWVLSNGIQGVVISFVSGKDGDSDDFIENVNVVVEDLKNNKLSLDAYTNLSVNNLKNYFKEFNLGELDVVSSSATLSGRQANKIEYNFKQGALGVKTMQIWTIKGNNAYVVSYVGEEENYNKYLDKVNGIIDSFMIY